MHCASLFLDMQRIGETLPIDNFMADFISQLHLASVQARVDDEKPLAATKITNEAVDNSISGYMRKGSGQEDVNVTANKLIQTKP